MVSKLNYGFDANASYSWHLKLLHWLWLHGMTPMSIIRLLGPVGPLLVRKAMCWRLERVPDTSQSKLALEEPLCSMMVAYMYRLLITGAFEDNP